MPDLWRVEFPGWTEHRPHPVARGAHPGAYVVVEADCQLSAMAAAESILGACWSQVVPVDGTEADRFPLGELTGLRR